MSNSISKSINWILQSNICSYVLCLKLFVLGNSRKDLQGAKGEFQDKAPVQDIKHLFELLVQPVVLQTLLQLCGSNCVVFLEKKEMSETYLRSVNVLSFVAGFIKIGQPRGNSFTKADDSVYNMYN